MTALLCFSWRILVRHFSCDVSGSSWRGLCDFICWRSNEC